MEEMPGGVTSANTTACSKGNIQTSFSLKHPSTEDELADMLMTINNKKEVFIMLEWGMENDRPCITSIRMSWKNSNRRDEFKVNISVLNGDNVKMSLSVLRGIFENSNCLKVMFSPRQDFTRLLYYGINIKNLFDVQSCVQCVQSDGSKMDEPMTLEQICQLYGINCNTTHEMEHVSTLRALIETYIYLKRRGGEWFRASKRVKYIYRRKINRLVRLTNNQRQILRDAKRSSELIRLVQPINNQQQITGDDKSSSDKNIGVHVQRMICNPCFNSSQHTPSTDNNPSRNKGLHIQSLESETVNANKSPINESYSTGSSEDISVKGHSARAKEKNYSHATSYNDVMKKYKQTMKANYKKVRRLNFNE